MELLTVLCTVEEIAEEELEDEVGVGVDPEGAVAAGACRSLVSLYTLRNPRGLSDRHQLLRCSFSCRIFSQSSSIFPGKALQAIDFVFVFSTQLIFALRVSTKFSTSTIASLFSAMLFTMEQRSLLTA